MRRVMHPKTRDTINDLRECYWDRTARPNGEKTFDSGKTEDFTAGQQNIEHPSIADDASALDTFFGILFISTCCEVLTAIASNPQHPGKWIVRNLCGV